MKSHTKQANNNICGICVLIFKTEVVVESHLVSEHTKLERSAQSQIKEMEIDLDVTMVIIPQKGPNDHKVDLIDIDENAHLLHNLKHFVKEDDAEVIVALYIKMQQLFT